MIYECSKEKLNTKDTMIFIEEDAIELYVQSIEIKNDFVYYVGSAIIDNEKYNDFTIEVELVEMPKSKSFESLLDASWDTYDIIF